MSAIPLSVAVHSIRCLEETDEVGADEPYVLVFAAELMNVAGKTVPVGGAVELYGPWENTHKGQVKTVILDGTPAADTIKKLMPNVRFPRPFWGMGGKAAPIASPDDVIFLVQMMENDDAKASDVRVVVQSLMVAAVGVVANSDLKRNELVEHFRRNMNDAVELARKLGLPNHDDRIGGVKELRLTASDLGQARKGSHQKTLEFSGDGGKYRVRFELKKHRLRIKLVKP